MSTKEEDDRYYRDTEALAFPKLDDGQLAKLEPLGHRRVLRRGEVLYRVGERNPCMAVVLQGQVEAVDLRDDVQTQLAVHGPRDVVGDIAMLDGTAAVATVRGLSDEAEILEIPAAELGRALAGLPGVGGPISKAFIIRRERLQRDPGFCGLRIVADANSRNGERLHDFLDKNHIPHRYILADSEQGREIAGGSDWSQRIFRLSSVGMALRLSGHRYGMWRWWLGCCILWEPRARRRFFVT